MTTPMRRRDALKLGMTLLRTGTGRSSRFARRGLAPAAVSGARSGPERLKQRLEWFRDQKFGLFLHWGSTGPGSRA